MPKIIAIICEYNPFHNGHKHQINKIRESFSDAIIVAIMSGNVTQRAELALFDKYVRAESAVSSGVNAVLELPYPYCASNAEIFAYQGVKIADRIGADYLCFGTESNDLPYLWDVADAIDSAMFEEKMREQISDKSISYASAKERALDLIGKKLPKNPNDILAVEYLRAIRRIGSKLKPMPIKREGLNYNDTELGEIMSAGGIRKHFYEKNELLSVPEKSKKIFEKAINSGAYLDKKSANDFFFRSIIMSNPRAFEEVFDSPSGCGYFISDIARNSSNSDEFFDSLTSKTYTYARLRRIITYYLTGVKEIPTEDVSYTTLLAFDSAGRELIKEARKRKRINIITKQADAKSLTEKEYQLFEISNKLDELYNSLLKSPKKAISVYKNKPIIM